MRDYSNYENFVIIMAISRLHLGLFLLVYEVVYMKNVSFVLVDYMFWTHRISDYV